MSKGNYDGIEVGDEFEYQWKSDDKVAATKWFWSSVENRYVDICRTNVLVSKSTDVVAVFNSKGFFHARVNNTSAQPLALPAREVLPHKI